MYRIRFPVRLLLRSASLMLACSAALIQAQQPAHDSQQTPQQSSSQESAPSAGQAQSKSEANSRIQRSAEDLLRGDPQLTTAAVQVVVDDHAITLTGTVDSYTQHQRVLALMQQYGRYRGIVDKLRAK